MKPTQQPFGELTELHVHVGGSVDLPIMWEIAQEQGIKLPTKNYWEFANLITLKPGSTYESYVIDLFHWTELIQSSPEAMERSIYSIASGAYRKNGITKMEIRFNPMLRNRGGERDLDHIIMASIHSMERAMLSYPIKLGIILMCDRRFPPKLNDIIASKAIKYAGRGIVGIDLAGPISPTFQIDSLKDTLTTCRKAGLGITIHTGETTDVKEMKEVITHLSPDRIGHGIRAVDDTAVMGMLKEQNIVLEVCPTSNISIKLVKDIHGFKPIFDSFKKHGVPFTINTDNPEMLQTNLLYEYEQLMINKVLSLEDLKRITRIAAKASFIKEKEAV